MHLVIGVIIFCIVALGAYVILTEVLSLSDLTAVVSALILGFIVEFIYMKTRLRV